MIVAEQKPLEQIAKLIEHHHKILVLGCAGCVTVCMSGGEKEAGILAGALRIKRRLEGKPIVTMTHTVTRQCDPEFIDGLEKLVEKADCVVSMACGVGTQYLAERYSGKYIIPAMNTKFAGGSQKFGVWEERCGLCGECILHLTGGICPVTRCPKSILNGPCGGSQNGRCEIDNELDCAWQLIYERLKNLGLLHTLKEIIPPKDWSKSRDGGPRRIIRKDLVME